MLSWDMLSSACYTVLATHALQSSLPPCHLRISLTCTRGMLHPRPSLTPWASVCCPQQTRRRSAHQNTPLWCQQAGIMLTGRVQHAHRTGVTCSQDACHVLTAQVSCAHRAVVMCSQGDVLALLAWGLYGMLRACTVSGCRTKALIAPILSFRIWRASCHPESPSAPTVLPNSAATAPVSPTQHRYKAWIPLTRGWACGCDGIGSNFKNRLSKS